MSGIDSHSTFCHPTSGHPTSGVDTRYSWFRLAVSLVIATIGGIGLWSIVVVLPVLQAEFQVARGAASLPYTLSMLGLAFGSVVMGRLADRFSIVAPILVGATALGIGYIAAAYSTSLWMFALIQGGIIGMFGSSSTFGPLVADISHWFLKRRGLAVAICASGNYLSGTIWPPIISHFVSTHGWRTTYMGIGIFCFVTMIPLALLLRRPSPKQATVNAAGISSDPGAAKLQALGVSAGTLQALLVVAGLACCVAMSMPQVHIVAYCADLGFGPARGAEMLSVMLGLGIVSRITSGWLSDKIGGITTLLIGSVMQAITLLLYVPFNGLMSLYVVSALFGLSQGGIVPSYALIVRDYFPAKEAGTRVGLVLMSTIVGMALGGWLSGVIYDYTGSYQAAFFHGVAWNVLNTAIGVWLLMKGRRMVTAQGAKVVAG
jgi:MFS family permease